MKKLFLLILFFLLNYSLFAQQTCAVMNFDAGKGLEQEDTEVISNMFSTYFHPNGYDMIERLQIDQALNELHFQQYKLQDHQKIQLGRFMRASLMVSGIVSIYDGKYQMDVRVINVNLGKVIVTEGASLIGDHRTCVEKLALRLTKKVEAIPISSEKELEPTVIQEYLKVFPYDLGPFQAVPNTLISRMNEQQRYGYGTWRLPTEEELALMRSEYKVGSGEYMTNEFGRGYLRLVTDKRKGEKISTPLPPSDYVDLGLPSHILWNRKNQPGYLFAEDAVKLYGNKLPTFEEWKELREECEWVWENGSYRVTGPNGNYIILSCLGFQKWKDNPPRWDSWNSGGSYQLYNSSYGYYWGSNVKKGENYNDKLISQIVFGIDAIDVEKNLSYYRFDEKRIVRLVKRDQTYLDSLAAVKEKAFQDSIAFIEEQKAEKEKKRLDKIASIYNTNLKADLQKQGYVDLGLSSGTWWKNQSEEGGYTFKRATLLLRKYKTNRNEGIPTLEQWKELSKSCKWERYGQDFKVSGPNGNWIIIRDSTAWYWTDTKNETGHEAYIFPSDPSNIVRFGDNVNTITISTDIRQKDASLSVHFVVSEEYIDLGLPSGTLWKNSNEGYFRYDEAVNKFGSRLPSKQQIEELINFCTWTWNDTKKGYDVVGPNGRSIFLYAAGSETKACDDSSRGYHYEYPGAAYSGYYWSFSEDRTCCAWTLTFSSDTVKTLIFNKDGNGTAKSVRLVK